MRYRVKGATFILGRLRKDGTRRVYAVRLRDWSRVLKMLRVSGITTISDGEALYVRVPNTDQRVFSFLERPSRKEVQPEGRPT
jgi:hypothetical protein